MIFFVQSLQIRHIPYKVNTRGGGNYENLVGTKGQLISEANFEVFI
jgi:hypothetical protein